MVRKGANLYVYLSLCVCVACVCVYVCAEMSLCFDIWMIGALFPIQLDVSPCYLSINLPYSTPRKYMGPIA